MSASSQSSTLFLTFLQEVASLNMLLYKNGDSGHNLPSSLPHSTTYNVEWKDHSIKFGFPILIFAKALLFRRSSLLTLFAHIESAGIPYISQVSPTVLDFKWDLALPWILKQFVCSLLWKLYNQPGIQVHAVDRIVILQFLKYSYLGACLIPKLILPTIHAT